MGGELRRGTRYPFRMGEGCEVVDTNTNLRTHKLKRSMNTNAKSVFKDLSVARHLSVPHDKYVVAPADKSLTTLFLFVNHTT